MLLELPVLAQLAAITGVVITFSGHHSIETALSTIVGDVVVLEVVVVFGLGLAVAGFDFVAFGDFPLAFEVDVFFDECEELETFPQILEPGGVIFEHGDDIVLGVLLVPFRLLLTFRHNRLRLHLYFSLLHLTLIYNSIEMPHLLSNKTINLQIIYFTFYIKPLFDNIYIQ